MKKVQFKRIKGTKKTKKRDNSAYYLIAEQPDGQKIGFIVDQPGK